MKITQEVLAKYKLAGIHPAADRLPYMTDEEFIGLVNSVRAYGLQTPIQVTPDAFVLDGRNRILAALTVGIDVLESEIVEPADPLVWVMSQNLNRRSLTVGQRAMIGKDIANMPPGRPGNHPDPGGFGKDPDPPGVDQADDHPLEPRIFRYSLDQAAAIANSSRQRISMAKVICEHAPKEDVLVRAGTMSLEAAYNIARNNKLRVLHDVRTPGVPKFPVDAPMPSGTDEYTIRVLKGIDSLQELIPTLPDRKTKEEVESVRMYSQLIQSYGKTRPVDLDPEIQAWAGHCGQECANRQLQISEGKKTPKIRSFVGVDLLEIAKINGKKADPKLKGKSITRKSPTEKFKIYWTEAAYILDRYELTDLGQFPTLWEKNFAEYLARRKAKLEKLNESSSTIKQTQEHEGNNIT